MVNYLGQYASHKNAMGYIYIYKYHFFPIHSRCMEKLSFPMPQFQNTTSATASPIHFKGFPAAQLAIAALNASRVAETKPLRPVEAAGVSFGPTWLQIVPVLLGLFLFMIKTNQICGNHRVLMFLVGGFSPTQSEKYAKVKFGSFPRTGMKIKNIWNH